MRRFSTGPRGKHFTLTDAMIARRDGIARGLGYVLRPCSLGPPSGGRPHRECWEDSEMTWEYKDGKFSSYYHCVRCVEDGHASAWYGWPDDVDTAAWAIDRGRPLPTDPPDVPAEVQGEMFTETRP